MVACPVVAGGVSTAVAAAVAADVAAASGLAASAEAWTATSAVAVVVFAVESSFETGDCGLATALGPVFEVFVAQSAGAKCLPV